GGIQLHHKCGNTPVVFFRRLQRVDGGEVGRGGIPRYVGVAGGIDSDGASIVSPSAAAQVGGGDQGGAGGVQFRHKHIITAVVSRLQRVNGGEVGRASEPRYVGVAGGIDGDATALANRGIGTLAAQVSGVDKRQGRAGELQLQHKRVSKTIDGEATAGGLDWVNGGEVGRGSSPRDVGIAGGIDSDAAAEVSATAPQVGGVDQGRAGGVQLCHKHFGRGIFAFFDTDWAGGLDRVDRGEVGR